MRKPIVAGNWKMNKTLEESETLATDVRNAVANMSGVDVVICPPFTALDRVAKALEGSTVELGAQDMHWEAEGAFTGEVSAQMLLTCGCRYVILGHSERRTYFGETDTTVNQKLTACLASDLSPIVCVGETLEERESEVTEKVIRRQVTGGYNGLSSENAGRTVVAYEPVWAIGTGLTATPEQAEDVHRVIRSQLSELYSEELGNSIRIQYGGSVKPENAAELFGQLDIDGGLIGGAALDAASFAAIVGAAGK